MGEARDVMDRATAAATAKDFVAVAACYAVDAIAVTPDQGEIRGRGVVTRYLQELSEAIPDIAYEYLERTESGSLAIDEGYVTGTNTGPLQMPSGEILPATGKQIKVRSCDVAHVESGLITSHRFYFDQMELLGQLGLLPDAST